MDGCTERKGTLRTSEDLAPTDLPKYVEEYLKLGTVEHSS